MIFRIVWLAFLFFTFFGVPSFAQIDLSGLVDVAYKHEISKKKNEQNSNLNATLLGENPFSLIRARFFLDSEISENIAVFSTILYDEKSGRTRIEGAFVDFANIIGNDVLNFHIGKIPTPFGAFAPRTYSNVNSLIGVPLVYHYRNKILADGIPLNNADQLRLKDEENKWGLPTLYDACWNTGIELYGAVSILDYNIAVVKGAVSSPTATNDGAQIVARIGINPFIGMKIGFSGVYGPYLDESVVNDDNFPAEKSVEAYHQFIYGIDFETSYAYFEFYAEAIRNQWDMPNITEGKLGNTGGYVEARYTIFPGFYYALRYGQIIYDKIESEMGNKESWDYDIKRIETGVGYSIDRNVKVKFIAQLNIKNIPADDETDHLIGFQLSTSF